MFITSPQQLPRLVRKNYIKTITVDIFDTVLLRKIYPEDKQFLLHAEKAVNFINQKFNIDITPFYFYSLRRHCRSVVDDNKAWYGQEREAKIVEIFGLLVDIIAQKYDKAITPVEKEQLIETLINCELKIETENLSLNKPLIATLRKIKAQGIRIFFVSDMYLSCEHVNFLLKYFQAHDVFDNGFCSSDYGYGKSKGKIFLDLKKQIPDFQLIDNLHVGDNHVSDYRSPQLLGVHAVHYKTLRNLFYRPIAYWLGELQLQFIRLKHKRSLKRQLDTHFREKTKSFSKNQKVLYKFGFTIAPALLKYLDYVSLISHLVNQPVFFLSSEGKNFAKLLSILGKKEGIYTLDTFNRINLLRGYTYLHFIKSSIKHPAPLLKVFSKGEGKATLDDFLKSIGVSRYDYGLTKLALHQLSLKELIQKLLESEVGNAVLIDSLNKSYDDLVKELSTYNFLNHNAVIVADIGWGGTIQILLEQMLEFLNRDMSLRGIYFGLTGFNMFKLPRPNNMKGVIFENINDRFAKHTLIEEIWENVLTNQDMNSEKLTYIQKGIFDYFEYFKKHITATPDVLFALYKSKIIRTIHNPTKREVMLIGSIEHEAGFGSTVSRPLVDMKYSRWQMYRMMVFSPVKFVRLYSKQYWPEGFGRWYGIRRILLIGTKIYISLKSIIGKKEINS